MDPTLFLCSGESRFYLCGYIHVLRSNRCRSAENPLPKNTYIAQLWLACGVLWAELGLLQYCFYPETINLHRCITHIRILLSESLSCWREKISVRQYSSWQNQKQCNFYWLSVMKDKVYNPGTEDELGEGIRMSLILNSLFVGCDGCVPAEGKHLYQLY